MRNCLHVSVTRAFFSLCFDLQFVSRVDIKYKRMNSNERVRIINSGSTTLPRQGFEVLRPEGEHKALQSVGWRGETKQRRCTCANYGKFTAEAFEVAVKSAESESSSGKELLKGA